MDVEQVFTIDTGYACAGVVVRAGIVVEAAPIFHWMLGKRLAEIRTWPRIKSIYDHAEGRTLKNP